MTKHSRLGHNSYSNPFMRPDTREGWGAILACDWLTVYNMWLWLVRTDPCSLNGEWNKHDLLDVRELAAVTLGGPGTGAGDRICNVANWGEFAQGHSYDRLMIISSWLTRVTRDTNLVQCRAIKIKVRTEVHCEQRVSGDKLKLFLSSGKSNNWIYQWILKRPTSVREKECH